MLETTTQLDRTLANLITEQRKKCDKNPPSKKRRRIFRCQTDGTDRQHGWSVSWKGGMSFVSSTFRISSDLFQLKDSQKRNGSLDMKTTFLKSRALPFSISRPEVTNNFWFQLIGKKKNKKCEKKSLQQQVWSFWIWQFPINQVKRFKIETFVENQSTRQGHVPTHVNSMSFLHCPPSGPIFGCLANDTMPLCSLAPCTPRLQWKLVSRSTKLGFSLQTLVNGWLPAMLPWVPTNKPSCGSNMLSYGKSTAHFKCIWCCGTVFISTHPWDEKFPKKYTLLKHASKLPRLGEYQTHSSHHGRWQRCLVTIPVGSFGMYETSRILVVCAWDIQLIEISTGSLLSLSRMDSRRCSMVATLQWLF